LKRRTTKEQAAGHRVRIMFFADDNFLSEFGIPLGVSAYGSTEAGGLCHMWLCRRGEVAERPGGMSRYGGRSRHDVQWRVSDDGEIHVRADRTGVLFEGYRKRGELIRPFDGDGWFATGDLGEVDAAGNLVFIERRAESIRVKGEFVPIGFVEEHFAKVQGVKDLAIWRRPSELIDDDVALFVVGESIDVDEVRSAAQELPGFMRPSVLIRLDEIPRGAGVGKILRRALGDSAVRESVELS
jgi:acyl-CoA synthetase (AMP-forming)/AMP-acid ligase II